MKQVRLGMAFLILLAIVCAETIPDFSLPRIDGSLFRMGEHIGRKVFIVDFWATWCQPCKLMLKRLQEIKNRTTDVEVIAISIDDASARAMAANYIKAKKFDFIALFDTDSQVARMFNPTIKVPFTLIIDRRGEIVYTHVGYVPGCEDEIQRRIDALKK